MKKIIPFAFLAMLLFDARLLAEDSLPIKTLEKVVVTVNRHETKLRDAPQRVDVIDRAALDRSSGSEAVDFIKKNSNIEVIQYPGGLSGVGIRGFKPEGETINKRTLLVVNGRPTASFNLSSINTGNLERIEILKGPASALYGSGAMGGVVNFIRKKSTGDLSTRVSTKIGSFGLLSSAIESGGALSSWLDFDFSLNHENQSENYRVGAPKSFEYDHSFSLRQNGSLRLGFKFSQKWRADLTVEGVKQKLGVSGDIDSHPQLASAGIKNLEKYGGDVEIEGAILGSKIKLSVFTARESNISQRAITFTPISKYNNWFGAVNTMKGFQLQDLIEFKGQTLTLGVDWSRAFASAMSWASPCPYAWCWPQVSFGDAYGPNLDYAKAAAPWAPDSAQTSLALYAQLGFSAFNGRVVGNVGARQDSYQSQLLDTVHFNDPSFQAKSETFSNFSPSVGLKGWLTKMVNVHGSWGSAFVVPNADELAANIDDPFTPGKKLMGNRNLRPESSVSYDLGGGLDGRWLGVASQLDVTYYSTDVTDFIESYTINPLLVSYRNVSDTVEIRGVEITLAQDFGALLDWAQVFRVFWNYSENTRYASVDATNSKETLIQLIAPRRYSYGIDYDNGSTLGASITGRHWEDAADQDWSVSAPPTWPAAPVIRYPRQDTVDISVRVRPLAGHTVQVQVANVFDAFTYEKEGYPMPGRTLSTKYTYEFH